MVTYTIRIRNPIIDREVMTIETDNRAVALLEAQALSKRHGIASVYENSSNIVIARFKYGVEEVVN